MAFCTHCGAKLPDGAKFCTTCGTPIAAAPTANLTPQPPRQQPAPRPVQQAQPVQPRPTQPVQARTTPQGGIVIDAPAGSTVTFSGGMPQETQTRVPDTKGEVELAGWEEFVPDGQAPKYQAPPTYQAGPAGYRPAAPAAPAQRTAPAQPKKRVAIGRIIIGVIVTAAVLAMIFNL